MTARVMIALKALLLAAALGLSGTAAHAQMTLNVFMNGLTFSAGNTLRVGLSGFNQGAAFTGDFYFGVIHPDGVTATFIVNLAPLSVVVRRLDSSPQTFPALTQNVAIPSDTTINLPNFFVYALSSSEPLGRYTWFAAVTAPRAFDNGLMENAAILAIDTAVFDISAPAERGGAVGGGRTSCGSIRC
jgi:hypothetical protein